MGLTRDVGRFADKGHFAAYNGSAPIEVSSGEKKIYRLSMRGSRQLNHALHMAAVTQVRHRHSEGRAYYDRKVAEGKTGKEALRALNAASAMPFLPPWSPTPAVSAKRAKPQVAREGKRGTAQ